MKFINNLLLILLSVILHVSNANIWDNLYLGQGVNFTLPHNFQAKFKMQGQPGNIEMLGSGDLNCLSIRYSILKVVFASVIANFTDGTLFTTYINECKSIKDLRLQVEFHKVAMDLINIGTLLLSRREENGMYKLEGTDLLNIVKQLDPESYQGYPDLTFYFDSNLKDLKKIKFEYPGKDPQILKVLVLTEYISSEEEFKAPDVCLKNEKSLNMMNLDEFKGWIEDQRDTLFEKIKPFLPSDIDLNDIGNSDP